MRRIEWLFVILFIASGLYCLAIPAGMPTFIISWPDWFASVRPYLRTLLWILIITGVSMSLWSIRNSRK